jgi:hypothetical protein
VGPRAVDDRFVLSSGADLRRERVTEELAALELDDTTLDVKKAADVGASLRKLGTKG